MSTRASASASVVEKRTAARNVNAARKERWFIGSGGFQNTTPEQSPSWGQNGDSDADPCQKRPNATAITHRCPRSGNSFRNRTRYRCACGSHSVEKKLPHATRRSISKSREEN